MSGILANPTNIQRGINVAARGREVSTDAIPFSAVKDQLKSAFLGLGASIGSAFSTVGSSGSGSILFSIAVMTFVVMIILLFVHFTFYPIFSFTAEGDGLISLPFTSDRQLVFKDKIAGYDLSANFTELNSCSYTLSMDVYLRGNFMANTNPRVILYRAMAPTDFSSTAEGGGSLLTRFGSGTNLIVWLDPIKNDLYVSCFTTTGSGRIVLEPGLQESVMTISRGGGEATGATGATGPSGCCGTTSTKVYSSTKRIENVPIRKPFRLTIAFSQQFIEVYINGKLRLTNVLQNLPLQITAGHFYPTTRTATQTVAVSNMAYWPRILQPREIERVDSKPLSTEILYETPAK